VALLGENLGKRRKKKKRALRVAFEEL